MLRWIFEFNNGHYSIRHDGDVDAASVIARPHHDRNRKDTGSPGNDEARRPKSFSPAERWRKRTGSAL
jgi:hypothetical protein